MELNEALKVGNKLAEYFVYCCGEGEHYVPLIERLRSAQTRSTILEAIYVLIRYGSLHLKQGLKEVSINQKSVENLFQFIRIGDSEKVSRFHSSLSVYIWNFEVKNIREQERYIVELLS